MKPRISFITLGVDDLQRAVAFYRDGLGFGTTGIVGTEFDHGAVAFFDCEHGLKLALWPRKSLAAEVRALMQRAERAGARIVKPAASTFYGGYAGYFQDLDGHLWEIAFNPGFEGLG
jgi:catechol 2,3-dioxygenase-like lactoylglutathione lyase family enzyme